MLEEGDILIRRVSNGFLIKTKTDQEGFVFVYEDTQTDYGEHQALINFLFDHFGYLFQSKKRGGLVLKIDEDGYGKDS